MARYIPDIKTQRWVIISPKRQARPKGEGEKTGEKILCPFCPGNEHLTPPEIYRWGKSYPVDKEWLVRVVPNKYPITDIHEVIIHSSNHNLDIAELPLNQIEILFKVYRERFRALSSRGQVLIFNNKGPKSGESLIHPHSQVVVIPNQIKLDVLSLEPIHNLIKENDCFIVYCPDFSQWPYEVWITQKPELENKAEFFGNLNDNCLNHLAKLTQEMLQRLLKKFPDLSYNFYIYPGANWYLRIIPRIAERAGFELGTGLSVNSVDPQVAVEELKK